MCGLHGFLLTASLHVVKRVSSSSLQTLSDHSLPFDPCQPKTAFEEERRKHERLCKKLVSKLSVKEEESRSITQQLELARAELRRLKEELAFRGASAVAAAANSIGQVRAAIRIPGT